MAAFDPATLDRWRALAIVDRDGVTVGTVSEFYLDRETGYPTWALINTGLFGASQTFVPLIHATEISDGLQVPYEKGHIKDAPTVDLHDELSPEEEARLFAHYGVDYEPATDTAVTVVDAPEPASEPDEGHGPVPADSGLAGSSAAAEAGRGPGEPPGPVPAEPGSVDTGGGAGQEPEPPDPTREVPAEPGTDEPPGDHQDAGAGAAGDPIPDEPGTVASDEVTQVHPQGLRSHPPAQDAAGSTVERDEDPGGLDRSRTAPADPEGTPATPADPNLSRTAPVEPGLPGSTAASPYGSAPTTIDKHAGPAEPGAEEPYRTPDGSGWEAGAPARFEEHEPVDPPAGASDRWREAKLAAERDRIARTAAAQHEERSPLERARRRLERLVGVGQEPDDLSPADREAAEQARRARLGFDDDDERMR